MAIEPTSGTHSGGVPRRTSEVRRLRIVSPGGVRGSNLLATIVDLLLARNQLARPFLPDLDPEIDRWYSAAQPISARQLTAAALFIVSELLEAGEAQVDEQPCAVDVFPGVSCSHPESEHVDGRCRGCLVDLGREHIHSFVGGDVHRHLDRHVFLGADGRFHLLEDCALETRPAAAWECGATDEPPAQSPLHEALELGLARCAACVGNWYEGAPRLIRAQLASAGGR